MGLFDFFRSGKTAKLQSIIGKPADDDFMDITLNIVEKSLNSGRTTYILKGIYKKNVVGLKVEIMTSFDYGISADGINAEAFYRNGTKLISIGVESDNLISAMAELYSINTEGKFSSQPVIGTAFSLNQKSGDLREKGFYKFKLFLGEEDEDLYSELYLNINTETNKVELAEKDFDYRQSIIMVLSHSLL